MKTLTMFLLLCFAILDNHLKTATAGHQRGDEYEASFLQDESSAQEESTSSVQEGQSSENVISNVRSQGPDPEPTSTTDEQTIPSESTTDTDQSTSDSSSSPESTTTTDINESTSESSETPESTTTDIDDPTTESSETPEPTTTDIEQSTSDSSSSPESTTTNDEQSTSGSSETPESTTTDPDQTVPDSSPSPETTTKTSTTSSTTTTAKPTTSSTTTTTTIKPTTSTTTTLKPTTSSTTTTTTIKPTTSSTTTTTTIKPTTSSTTTTTITPTTTTNNPITTSTTTEDPDVVIPTIRGEENGSICLIASLDMNITVNYKTKDNKTEPKTFSIPRNAKYSTACAGQTTTILGQNFTDPIVLYEWNWQSRKRSLDSNNLAIVFSKVGEATELQRVLAAIRTDNEIIFPGTSKEPVGFEIKFEGLQTDYGKSYICLKESPTAADENGHTVTFSKVAYQIGTNLSSTFGEGSTCGASSITVALLTLLFTSIMAVTRWF